ncbi:MAG: hypothetical protein ACRYFS_24430 [Janthinobacterium lividum]
MPHSLPQDAPPCEPQPVFQFLPLTCPKCDSPLDDDVDRYSHFLVCTSPNCFFQTKVYSVCTETTQGSGYGFDSGFDARRAY